MAKKGNVILHVQCIYNNFVCCMVEINFTSLLESLRHSSEGCMYC